MPVLPGSQPLPPFAGLAANGVNLRARALIRDARPHPQLPVKTSAPEDEHGLRLLDEFLDPRASPVRVNLQCLVGHIHAAKYDRSGVDGAVFAHRSQHRRSPSMVPVLARAPEFLPYLLANLLGVESLFSFFERWLAKFTRLPLSAKLSGVKYSNKSSMRRDWSLEGVIPSARPIAEASAATLEITGTSAPSPSRLPAGVLPRPARRLSGCQQVRC